MSHERCWEFPVRYSLTDGLSRTELLTHLCQARSGPGQHHQDTDKTPVTLELFSTSFQLFSKTSLLRGLDSTGRLSNPHLMNIVRSLLVE